MPRQRGRREPHPLDERFSPDRVLAALGQAVIVTDLGGLIQYWNPAAERVYGWSAADALGRDIAAVTVPDVTRELGAEIMDLLRQGRPWSGAFTVRRKDGTTFPAFVNDAGLFDDAGMLVGLVGVSTDLADALRALLAASTDASLLLAGDGTIAFVSPTASRLFGWGADAILGQPVWSLVHADDQARAIDHYDRLLSGGSPVPPVECRVRRQSGDWQWVDLQLSTYPDHAGVRELVCNLRDVTERVRARDELVHLAERLRGALASQVILEQAKGIVAGREGVDLDEAHARIRRQARDGGEDVAAVAQRIVNGDVAPG